MDYKVNRPIKLAITRILFWSLGTIQSKDPRRTADIDVDFVGSILEHPR